MGSGRNRDWYNEKSLGEYVISILDKDLHKYEDYIHNEILDSGYLWQELNDFINSFVRQYLESAGYIDDEFSFNHEESDPDLDSEII